MRQFDAWTAAISNSRNEIKWNFKTASSLHQTYPKHFFAFTVYLCILRGVCALVQWFKRTLWYWHIHIAIDILYIFVFIWLFWLFACFACVWVYNVHLSAGMFVYVNDCYSAVLRLPHSECLRESINASVYCKTAEWQSMLLCVRMCVWSLWCYPFCQEESCGPWTFTPPSVFSPPLLWSFLLCAN